MSAPERAIVRLRALDPSRADALLAAAWTAAGLAVVALYAASARDAVIGIASTLAQGAGLALRRRIPLLGWALTMTGFFGIQLVGGQLNDAAVPQWFAALFAVYSAGAHLTGRRLGVAAVVTPVILELALVAGPFPSSAGDRVSTLVLGWIAPMLAGRVVRSRAELNRLLRARAETSRARRARAAADAVAEERARIAAELHDVVAHALSAMVIQAGAARRGVRDDPGRARGAFEAVEGTGREALAEIRRLLGVLRRGDEDLALAPQPSLEHLSALVSRARAAGLAVDVRDERPDRAAAPLAAGVDLTAYRVLQAALGSATNGGGARSANVRIRYAGDMVLLEVRDDGAGLRRDLRGVRERVSLYGGELHAGPSRGGHALVARLPVGSAA